LTICWLIHRWQQVAPSLASSAACLPLLRCLLAQLLGRRLLGPLVAWLIANLSLCCLIARLRSVVMLPADQPLHRVGAAIQPNLRLDHLGVDISDDVFAVAVACLQ
jgi:hypothetical protein